MAKVALIISIVLFVFAIRLHAMTHVHTITKVEKTWYDRLWSGSRPAKDNLTEKGLAYRKQSDLYAIGGLVFLGLYVLISATW